MSTAPLREALESALPDRPFRVELWDGTALASTNGGPTFALRSPQALGHVLRAPSQLGVGRAYVSGALDVDDVEAALALLDSWRPPPIEVRDRARIAAAAVRAGALRSVPHVPDAELRPRGRRHSVARDRRSVRHHYDVSNAFFELFLGGAMTYSCALFSRGATTLEEAQEAKLEMVCAKLGLEPGMRVLDVGCGPGRHAHELARRGIAVHGVDISEPFVELARAGAPPGATFERLDARDLRYDGEFDAVICLCQGAFGLMTEAGGDDVVVGGMARALTPGGRLSVSAFNAYFAVKYHEAATFDADRGIAHERTEVRDEAGVAVEVDLWTGCYTPRELRLLFARHGLVVDRVSSVEPGHYGDDAPTTETAEYLVLAHRPRR